MLVSRTYKNNLGYQIDVRRPEPIYSLNLNRYNKNYYTVEDNKVSMAYNKGNLKGLQFGGTCDKNIQSGQGIDPKTIYNTLQLLYTGAKLIPKLYSSEPATILKNAYGKMMNPKNSNWRSGFAGEKHLLTKKGITYNWCGPGTNVSKRLERGDMGVDNEGLDLVCKTHDIDYYNAKNWNDVRTADTKFLTNVDNTQIGSKSKTFIKGLFKAKMLGEDVGLLKKDQFTTFPNIQNQIPPKIEETQIPAIMSGQGNLFSPNHDPARKLKNKIKKYRNKQKTDKILNIAFNSIKKRLK